MTRRDPFVAPGLALLLLGLALGAGAQPPIDVERVDLPGQVRFLPNGNFLSPASSACDPALEIPDPILLDDWDRASHVTDWITHSVLSAELQGDPSVRSDGELDGPLPHGPPPFDLTPPETEYLLVVPNVADPDMFDVNATIWLDSNDDVYRFAEQESAAYGSRSNCGYPPPLDMVDCLPPSNFNECAGVIVVRFVRDATCDMPGTVIDPDDPNYPTEGTVQAFVPPLASGGAWQAQTTVRFDREVRFPVRACVADTDTATTCPAGMASSTYNVLVSVKQGDDEFTNTVRTKRGFTGVVVTCNGVTCLTVELPCPLDPPGSGSGPGPGPGPGPAPTGEWQVIGTDPSTLLDLETDVIYHPDTNPNDSVPRVWLHAGPDGNQRFAQVEPPHLPPYDYSAGDLSSFDFVNVIPSSRPSFFDDGHYRVLGYHVLQDGYLNSPQGSGRGQPCGPADLDGDTVPDNPCGRITQVQTNIATATGAANAPLPGWLLWSDCLASPGSVPLDGSLDTENDWLYIDAAADPLIRCPNFGAADPGCSGDLVLPPAPGTAGYEITAADQEKLFVMQPGIVFGRVILTDGLPGSPDHVDVLENLSVTASLFDPAIGTRLDSWIQGGNQGDRDEGTGADPFPFCNNRNSFLGNVRGSLLHDVVDSMALEDLNPAGFEDVHSYRYRLVAGQLSNASGWYKSNTIELLFSDPSADPDLYWNGRVRLNGIDLPEALFPGQGDDEQQNWAWNLSAVADHAYCFGQFRVRIVSLNAPLSLTDPPFVLGASSDTSSLPFGTPEAYFNDSSRHFTGVTDSALTGLVNVAVPAGEYDLRASVVFAGQSSRTTYATFLSEPIGCGEVVTLCTEPPACMAPTVGGVMPVDDDCLNGTVDFDICLNDPCGMDPATVDVLVCSDDEDLDDPGLTIPAGLACGPAAPHPVAVFEGLSVSALPPCSTLTLEDVPIADGPPAMPAAGSLMTDYEFHVAGLAGSATCSLADVVTPDATAPTFDCPEDVLDCTDQPTQSHRICLTNLDDNCHGSGALEVEWSATGALVTSGTGNCAELVSGAGLDYPVGTTTVTWTVTDSLGNSDDCSTQVVIHSAPVACITGPDAVCRTEDASGPISVLLDASEPPAGCTDPDAHDEMPADLPDDFDYTWSLVACPAGTVLVPAGSPERITVEVPDVPSADCLAPETCEVSVTIEELDPSDPSTVLCSDSKTHLFTILPRPIADPGGPYEKCFDPSSLPISLPLDMGASDPCCPGGTLAHEWSLLPPCDANPFVRLLLPTSPVPIFQYDGPVPIDCGVELRVTAECGSDPDCSAVATTQVRLLAGPTVDAGPDLEACEKPGATLVLSLAGSGVPLDRDCSLSFEWSNSPTRPCRPGSGPLFDDVTDPTTNLNLDGDVLGTCEVCLIATEDDPVPPDCSGCQSVDCVEILVDTRPSADPGGPYTACDAPTIPPVPLDGTGSDPRRPTDPGCALDYSWVLRDCTGVTLSSATDPMPDAILTPGMDPGMDCRACLTVSHDPACVDPDCTSEEVCADIDLCDAPDADFSWRFLLSTDCADPVRIEFTDLSSTGGCPGTVTESWDFDGGTVVSATPPIWLVEYPTSGPRTVTRSVTVGTCTDEESRTICVPGCVDVGLDQGTGNNSTFDIECSGMHDPCESGDVVIDLALTDFCCPDFELLSGTAAFQVGPCTPGGAETTVVADSIVLVGAPPMLRVTFLDECWFNALKAMGCDCDDATIDAHLDVSAEVRCLPAGPMYPIEIASDLPGGATLHCSNPTCFSDPFCPVGPGGPCHEGDCGNGIDDDGDGLADCADALDCPAGVPPC